VEKSNDKTSKQKGWERNKGEMREGRKNSKEIKGEKVMIFLSNFDGLYK
jgi:hypothetical protein